MESIQTDPERIEIKVGIFDDACSSNVSTEYNAPIIACED